MQGVYIYIPETNHVARVYTVAAVLYLQFVQHVMLFRVLNMFCTFTLVLPKVCLQCPKWVFFFFFFSFLISCFPYYYYHHHHHHFSTIVIIMTLNCYWFSYTYPFLIFRSLSAGYNYLSSSCLARIPSFWWLLEGCLDTCKCLLPLWESQYIRTQSQICIFLIKLFFYKSVRLASRPGFSGTGAGTPRRVGSLEAVVWLPCMSF
jgi:hypothetical protein